MPPCPKETDARASMSRKNAFVGKSPTPSAFCRVVEIGDSGLKLARASTTHVVEVADARLMLTRLIIPCCRLEGMLELRAVV